MPAADSLDVDAMRTWLEHVRQPETVRRLMQGIAIGEGATPDEIARWYDDDPATIREWLEELDRLPIVTIAESEGIDFDSLASSAGLTESTVRDWFTRLADRPIEEAASIIGRYAARVHQPIVAPTDSRVHYLDYEAIEEHGWSINDPELFERASTTGLNHDQYGRVLVEAGQTILEAVEQRGLTWPYACRGGACANCAVLVLEGDIAMPGQTVLTEDQIRTSNARLTCVGVPVTEEIKLVMNVQHLDAFEGLRLPSPMTEGEPVL